jgi:resuscitation-promoting factor RpfB
LFGLKRRLLLASGLFIITGFNMHGAAKPVPGNLAFADSSKIVSLYFDGQKKVVTTDASTVGDVLRRAGVTLGDEDVVEPRADTEVPRGFFNINVFRSRPVLIVDQDKTVRSRSAYLSPRLIVNNADITTYAEDEFDTETVTDFTGDGLVGHKVTIRRANRALVFVDGKVMDLRSQANTVGAFLQDKGIALGEKDSVSPVADTVLRPNQRINITRVNEVVVTKAETLPRPVKTVKDDNLELGHKAVRQAGSDGRRTVTYLVRYHNGRQALKIEGVVEPVVKIIAEGTKVTDSVWYRLRVCESSNNYQRNSGNGYYGAYQFDLSTWQSNGGTGYPHEAPAQVQDQIAQKVQARRGWYPWPACARTLGLI